MHTMCVFRVKVGHHTGIRKKKKNQQARVSVFKELKLVTIGKKKKKKHASVSRVLKTGHCNC